MKLTKYILCAASVLLLGSCTNKFDEVNRNPNEMESGAINPAGMMQELLFKGTQTLLYRTWQLNGELIQYTVSGTGNNSYHRYVITNAVMSSAWDNFYRYAANAEHMRLLSIEKGSKAHEAAAITFKVMLMQNLTDMFGEAPYSEAFKGATGGVTKPRFDTQSQIYEQLLADLEYANTIYASNPVMSSPERDLLYKGKIELWRKFNNSLYLRLLMRLSNRNREFGVAAKIKAIFSNPTNYPVFTSNDDNATLYYDKTPPFVNDFGNNLESEFTTTGRRPAEQLIKMMDKPGDPRIAIWFVQAKNADKWLGAVSGQEAQESGNANVSLLNKANLGDFASPYSNMKYDEVLFIYAEAIKLGWIDGGDKLAEQYYNDAIRASIRFWSSINVSGQPIAESTIDRFLENTPYDGTLEQILNQKFVALFWTGFEAWHDYRRTGYPALQIGLGTQNDHILPTRMGYPLNVLKTNPESSAAAVARLKSLFQGNDDMKTPVWWSRQAVQMGIQ